MLYPTELQPPWTFAVESKRLAKTPIDPERRIWETNRRDKRLAPAKSLSRRPNRSNDGCRPVHCGSRGPELKSPLLRRRCGGATTALHLVCEAHVRDRPEYPATFGNRPA